MICLMLLAGQVSFQNKKLLPLKLVCLKWMRNKTAKLKKQLRSKFRILWTINCTLTNMFLRLERCSKRKSKISYFNASGTNWLTFLMIQLIHIIMEIRCSPTIRHIILMCPCVTQSCQSLSWIPTTRCLTDSTLSCLMDSQSLHVLTLPSRSVRSSPTPLLLALAPDACTMLTRWKQSGAKIDVCLKLSAPSKAKASACEQMADYRMSFVDL